MYTVPGTCIKNSHVVSILNRIISENIVLNFRFKVQQMWLRIGHVSY